MAIFDTPFPLTDLASFKSFADQGKTPKNDALIESLIRGVSRQIEDWCNLRFELKTRTKDFDIERHERYIDLETAPITSITSVIHDLSRDFSSSNTLGTDEFTFDPDTGHLELEVFFAAGRKVLRVVYVGGIATTLQGLRSLAPDLETACLIQTKEVFMRQQNSALDFSVSEQGGSIRVGGLMLVPYVKTILHQYRRIGTG